MNDDFLKIVLQQSNRVCIECGRKFDMFDEEQSEEWHNGHDCDPSMSWSELAELTHATQVEKFGWCSCEDNEGKENPYTDCPEER